MSNAGPALSAAPARSFARPCRRSRRVCSSPSCKAWGRSELRSQMRSCQTSVAQLSRLRVSAVGGQLNGVYGVGGTRLLRGLVAAGSWLMRGLPQPRSGGASGRGRVGASEVGAGRSTLAPRPVADPSSSARKRSSLPAPSITFTMPSLRSSETRSPTSSSRARPGWYLAALFPRRWTRTPPGARRPSTTARRRSV
jgi:hypothetical protein